MTRPPPFAAYLAAKQRLDDHAIHPGVRDRLIDAIEGRDSLRILEVGAGIGTNVERLAALTALPPKLDYTAVELEPSLVELARSRLPDRLEGRGYSVRTDESTLEVRRGERRLTVEVVTADATAFIDRTNNSWELLVAHAVLDLTDVVEAVDRFADALTPGGLLYCPITYDGLTAFVPPIEPSLDRRIVERYHRHMDRKVTPFGGGDSRAGRRLLAALPDAGYEVLAAGASDWVVWPHEGGYHEDEAVVIRYVLGTIEDALAGDPALDDDRLAVWLAARRNQLEAGELCYLAHHLDVLGRAP